MVVNLSNTNKPVYEYLNDLKFGGFTDEISRSFIVRSEYGLEKIHYCFSGECYREFIELTAQGGFITVLKKETSEELCEILKWNKVKV